jgi:hypothetical protein
LRSTGHRADCRKILEVTDGDLAAVALDITGETVMAMLPGPVIGPNERMADRRMKGFCMSFFNVFTGESGRQMGWCLSGAWRKQESPFHAGRATATGAGL